MVRLLSFVSIAAAWCGFVVATVSHQIPHGSPAYWLGWLSGASGWGVLISAASAVLRAKRERV